MGRSGKSRIRTTDQETQSPMLKIFKDIMQRENDDPEKRNLLKDHYQDKKKKKQYSASKSKSDQVSINSSGTERCKRTTPYKNQEQINLEYEQEKRESEPFRNEKKESWWLWGDTEKVEREESCSCVSCALKKVIGSEFMCVGCLLTVFTLSVVVAFLLVFRSVPTMAMDEKELQTPTDILDSERLKRKIDLMRERRDFNVDLSTREKNPWDDSITKPLGGLSAISEDFAQTNLRDFNNLDANSRTEELSNVLGGNNGFDLQTSDRLREFYKKLIQTDAQINMLKKGTTDFTLLKTDDDKYRSLLDRAKRSLTMEKVSRLMKGNGEISKPKRNDSIFLFKTKDDKIRNSRYIHKSFTTEVDSENVNGNIPKKIEIVDGYTNNANKVEFTKEYPGSVSNDSLNVGNYKNDATNGIVIEKNKLLVKFKKPEERKKVPKCSHSPKESKSHEKQLKHPFYKHTQRLDELLDRFMGKGLPGLLTDTFGTDVIFKGKCKHTNVDGVKKVSKDGFYKTEAKPETSSNMNKNGIYGFTAGSRYQTTGSNRYGVMLNESSLIDPEINNPENIPLGQYSDKGFNHRKLMQADEVYEENLGYEDLKEVLTDDLEGHYDTDRHGDRNKRDEDLKSQTPGSSNFNWKYPIDIKSLIKHAALSAINPRALRAYADEARLDTKEESPEAEKGKPNIGDVQYVEDYLINKYDKLAQAYSDYGVLDEKKESVRNEKDEPVKPLDHRVKLSIDKSFLKGGFFDRLKKGSQPSEGIRFEVQPSGSSHGHREDGPLEIYKYIQKHVKLSHGDKYDSPSIQSSTMLPTSEELEIMYTPKTYEETQSFAKPEKKFTNNDAENGLVFAITKGRRSLKSIDSDSDFSENVMSDASYHEDSRTLDETRSTNNVPDSLANDQKVYKRQIFNNSNFPKSKNVTKLDVLFDPHLNTTVGKDAIGNTNIMTYNSEFNHSNSEENKEGSGMSLSDFFMMLANFFSFLDGVDLSNNKQKISSNGTVNDKLPGSYTISKPTKEIIYPMYDSEGIGNIAHRSRVLLSIDDKTISEPKATSSEEQAHMKQEDTSYPFSTEIGNAINTTGITRSQNVTKAPKTEVATNSTEDPDVTDSKIKSVVKRNVDDTNLIFWNEMYDEEYGVNTDHLEDSIRDKHSAKLSNIVQSSNIWLKDKVKKLTNNIHKKSKQIANSGEETTSKKKSKPRPTTSQNQATKKIVKRDLKMINDADGSKVDFAALTANMKEVCRQAAKAVQHTRNLEVREGSKESAAASSLMQQLVRLMTDLVDFQVQQKTCLKLPPDLQNFLEWLTSNDKPDDMKRGFDDIDNLLILENTAGYDKMTDNYLDLLTPVTEKEFESLDRSNCLDTIQAVQDLKRQYEEMSEEDQSKMVGIKEYLENQLSYLEKQLNTPDYENSYQKADVPSRYQRNVFTAKKDHRIGRIIRKFTKNSGPKRTKTTASIKDDLNLEKSCTRELKSNTVKRKSVFKTEGKVGDSLVKRNVQETSTNFEKRNLNRHFKAIDDVE